MQTRPAPAREPGDAHPTTVLGTLSALGGVAWAGGGLWEGKAGVLGSWARFWPPPPTPTPGSTDIGQNRVFLEKVDPKSYAIICTHHKARGREMVVVTLLSKCHLSPRPPAPAPAPRRASPSLPGNSSPLRVPSEDTGGAPATWRLSGNRILDTAKHRRSEQLRPPPPRSASSSLSYPDCKTSGKLRGKQVCTSGTSDEHMGTHGGAGLGSLPWSRSRQRAPAHGCRAALNRLLASGSPLREHGAVPAGLAPAPRWPGGRQRSHTGDEVERCCRVSVPGQSPRPECGQQLQDVCAWRACTKYPTNPAHWGARHGGAAHC